MLDLTSMISGPVATMMLADQGAEVIKVEPPEGELVRHMGRNPGGLTSVFLSANRSKRSIALDLKNPAGVDVLKRLISTADVFVQNFRPGAIDRMGLGESVVRDLNASIIYVSISGLAKPDHTLINASMTPLFKHCRASPTSKWTLPVADHK